MNLPLKLLIEECIENCQYSDEAALASRWISDVRILGEDEFLKKDVLYIDLGETSIPENSKYENNIVVLTHIREVGKLPADYQWIAVVENLNPLQIAGKMQNVFREFQKWNMKLYDACSFGCNLQELLNVSANMTKNCIYIADMSFKVLVYANAEIMPEISATWRYQVAHGYLPVHVMKGLLNSGEFEDLNGFRRAAHFYSKNFNVPFLTKNVFYNNKPQAHLFIVNSLKRPTYRDIAIGQILGEFIEQHFFLLSEFKLNRISNNFEAFYVDVVSGNLTDANTVQKQIGLSGWNLSDSYRIAVADIGKHDSGFKRTVMYQIESQTDLRCFLYETSLIILQRDVKESDRLVEKKIENISRQYALEICMGSPFSGFMNLRFQYLTIMKVMGIAGVMKAGVGFYRATDYSLHYWIDYISHNPELQQFCNRNALLLKEFDMQNKTDYFETYFTYLQNDRNVVQTSKVLHVHRNTLMYRLEKIQKLIGEDEGKVEQKTHMLLSMMLLDYQNRY